MQRRLGCRTPDRMAALLAGAAARLGREPASVRILDLGAGNGVSGEALAARGMRPVVGLDILPAARDAALRDRPGRLRRVSRRRPVALTPAEEQLIRDAAPNTLACVGSVGGGHLPAEAVAAALELLPPDALRRVRVRRRAARGSAPGAARGRPAARPRARPAPPHGHRRRAPLGGRRRSGWRAADRASRHAHVGDSALGVAQCAHGKVDVERSDLVRARQRAREAVLRGESQDRAVPSAQRQDGAPDLAEARRLGHQRGGPLRGHRQGLRADQGALRRDHARRARGARPRAEPHDRHRGLRRPRRHRPDLLRPSVLPRPRQGRGEGLRAAAPCDGGVREGRRGAGRAALQGAAGGDPPGAGRGADDGDDDLRRRGRRARARSTTCRRRRTSRSPTARSRWPSS